MNALKRLNIEIDHDKEYLHEALGISEEKASEIFKAVDETYERNSKYSMVIRDLLSKYDGAEAVLAIFNLGVKVGARRVLEELSAVLSAMLVPGGA